MDHAEARTSSILRPHMLAVAALLVLVAGCQASGRASPAASPVPPVDYTVRSPGSTPPPKAETLRAIDVLSARLRTLKVGMFSAAAGDAITFTIPPSANPAAVRAVLSATGQVAFVPLPPAEYGTGNRQGTV